MDGWDSAARRTSEGTEIGVGVGEEGVRMDEEREPMLIGVAGFLENPTIMGAEPLVEVMLGMAR